MGHATGWSDDERAALASRLLHHVGAGTTDMADEVMVIPVSEFTDPDLAGLELDQVFRALPLVVAHGTEIPQPYDFKSVEVAGTRFIVNRLPDGSVRGHVNVCRHRGSPVTRECSGNARVFACPYHGWSYDADGSLRSVTDAASFGELPGEPAGLVSIPVEERHGMVWAIVNPDAKLDVADWLGPMDRVLGSYGLSGYHQFRTADVEVACNWKILVDAFLDGYHLKFVHRKSAAPYFYNNIYAYDRLGRHARFTTPRRNIDRYDASEPASIERLTTSGHFLMPNATMLRQPTHFEMLSFRPHPSDPQACVMTFRLLVPERPATDEQVGFWDRNWSILMEVVRDEDLPLNRLMQHAAADPYAPPLVLGRNEVVNQQFHRQLQEVRGGSQGSGGRSDHQIA